MHMCTGLSWHSTGSNGRPCFLYLSLYFPCIIITCLHAWSTYSIQSDRDLALFHPRESSRELTPTFQRKPKIGLFLHSPARLHSSVRKETKGQLHVYYSLTVSPLICPYHGFIPRVLALSSLSTPLPAFFYPFLVFRSFVVRRLLPNADTRQ
jgi:hypothetical protein